MRIFARILLVAAGVAALLSVSAFFTGGFRVHVLGVPVSARGWHRAAFFALAGLSAGLCLHDDLRRRAASVGAPMAASRFPLAIALAAAAVVLWTGLDFGARAAGYADAYGYVSQMDLWRQGNLHIAQDFVASVPWPDADWTFAPLGYRPAPNHTIVPVYPPGLPLLMLAASLVFGSLGPYVVAPIAGAGLVLLTYAVGARLSTRLVGSLADVCGRCPAVHQARREPRGAVRGDEPDGAAVCASADE